MLRVNPTPKSTDCLMSEEPDPKTTAESEPKASTESEQKLDSDARAETTATEVKVEGKQPFVPDIKVVVHFRSAGSAPIMKQTKFKISATQRFSVLHEFLRKQLKFKPGDALFLYCQTAFAPSPDETIYDLYQCFQVGNELIINYSIQDAWG